MMDRFFKEGVGCTQSLSKSVPDLGGLGYSFQELCLGLLGRQRPGLAGGVRGPLTCAVPATCGCLSPPKQQLGVVLALQVLVNEVGQQLLQHVGGILQLALQHRHDERSHVATVAHGEAALRFERADEGQQEHLVVDKLGKELQAFLHTLLPVARDLQRRPGSDCHL